LHVRLPARHRPALSPAHTAQGARAFAPYRASFSARSEKRFNLRAGTLLTL
jgi:hypothetical protein